MVIKIDTANLKTPEAFGYILSYYFYDADTYEVQWDDMPEFLKIYYYYIDSEERKKFIAHTDGDGLWLADWSGDRFVSDGSKFACAPTYYKDNVWVYIKRNTESIRWGLDIDDNLNGEDDEFDDEGFEQ